MTDYKLCIIANACITKYKNGEGSIKDLISYYNRTTEETDIILSEILERLPHIDRRLEVEIKF